jgi:hypothetical protein
MKLKMDMKAVYRRAEVRIKDHSSMATCHGRDRCTGIENDHYE